MKKVQMKTPKKKYSGKWDTKRKPTKNWQPDPRDIEILEFVWQHGFLHPMQIAWLIGKSKRRGEELLKRLWDNGYLNRPDRNLRRKFHFMPYVLSRRGARLIAKRFNLTLRELDWVREPLWDQLDHDGSVTDFRILLTLACEAHPDFSFNRWVNETTFRSWQDEVHYENLAGKPRKRRIYIDGFAHIIRSNPDDPEKPFHSRLLIECEVSPKTQPRFADHKILPQFAYLRSEIYQKRLGGKSGRILYLVPTEEKLNNFRQMVRNALPKREWPIFWFTTYEQVNLKDMLFGEYWLRPGDKSPVSLYKP